MKIADITFENDTLFLSGELDFFNVMSVYQKSLNLIKTHHPKYIDLSRLADTNSVVIALMIEWARLTSDKLTFRGVSPEILSLSKASNLDGLFGFSS